MDPFQTRSYSFDLPPDLIAAEPLDARDEARLLVVRRKSRSWAHSTVRELPRLLPAETVVVANNTRVFKARLLGERVGTGGKMEFFLLHRIEERRWEGLMRSGGRILPGYSFRIPLTGGGFLEGCVTQRRETESGAIFTAEFSADPLAAAPGEVPLPPYIVQQRAQRGIPAVRPDELEIYNTVYSKEEGSVAAPTAGRHFTPELIGNLRARGMGWEEITLHVGIGTFQPVAVEDVRDHSLHPEWTKVTAETAERLFQARSSGRKIMAVGTTTARTLEGRSRKTPRGWEIEPGMREVNLFIHPGAEFEWKWADLLLTNFHLPGSSLIMLVAARMGDLEFTREVYQEAIRERYRFYSYGDAMVILDE